MATFMRQAVKLDMMPAYETSVAVTESTLVLQVFAELTSVQGQVIHSMTHVNVEVRHHRTCLFSQPVQENSKLRA